MSNESGVTVRFYGICMHVRGGLLDRIGPDRTVGHRVILVNASQDRIDRERRLSDEHIQPHHARLSIPAVQLRDPQLQDPDWFTRLPDPTSDVVIWPLNGVILTIDNAIPQQSDEIADCIPRLSEYAKPAPPPLRLGNRDVSGNLSETACFFDFPRVPVQGEATTDLASVGVISIAVSATPSLRVTRFGDHEDSSFVLPLEPGTEISVSNAPDDPARDHDPDFLLYFLATDWVPADARWPTREHWVPCDKPNPLKMAGPGCSNSVYP